jgi:hypothetical protein
VQDGVKKEFPALVNIYKFIEHIRNDSGKF